LEGAALAVAGSAAVAVALAYYASRELNKGPIAVKSRHRRTAPGITKGYGHTAWRRA